MRAVGLVLLASLCSCGSTPGGEGAATEGPPPATAASRPNIVLVTMDTVRADRIGAYGYDKATTPTFDALAARGQRFDRAYSPYPLTIPSHSSLMTGLYPPQHGVRDNGDAVLSPEFDTLAEVLNEAGYATGAAVSAFVTSRQWGFQQGFDAYFDEVPRAMDFWHASRRGELVVDDALEWAKGLEEDAPVFLWVHMYDAHLPLEPVAPFAEAHKGRPYDAEIAYVDAQVGRLVDHFGTENTMYVVTADHGESNGEHVERTHGLWVYNSTQHIPMVIAGPGVPAEVVSQPVSLVDVMPTVLDHAGLPVPDGLAGRPVPAEEQRPVYLETWQLSNRLGFAPHVGLVHGDHKLIDLPSPELYSMSADAAETNDLATSEPAMVAEIKALLDGLGFEPPDTELNAISSETAEELAALGYVVGTRPDVPVEELPDPKEHLGLIRTLQGASARDTEDPEAAIASLEPMVVKYPEIAEIRIRLAQLYLKVGQVKESEKVISDGIALSDKASLRTALVQPLMAQGRLAEAADVLLSVREQQEFSPRYRLRLLEVMLTVGRVDEAEAIALEFMKAYPDDLEVVGLLGVLYIRTKREAEGWPLVARAIEAEKPSQDVAFSMGMRALAEKRTEEAFTLFELETQHHPLNARPMAMLAERAKRAKDWEAWKQQTSSLVRVEPRKSDHWRDHAQALFNLKDFEGSRAALTKALELAPKDADIVMLDANLLLKEGKREAAEQRVAEARKLHEARSQ